MTTCLNSAISCGFERKLKNTQRARYLRIAEKEITSTTNFAASNAKAVCYQKNSA